jgi:hypothetical protein
MSQELRKGENEKEMEELKKMRYEQQISGIWLKRNCKKWE